MPHIPNFRLSKRQVSLYLHHWRFLGSKRRVWGTLAILHSVVEPRQLPSLALDRPIGHCTRRPSPSPLGSVASSVPETSLDRSFKKSRSRGRAGPSGSTAPHTFPVANADDSR